MDENKMTQTGERLLTVDNLKTTLEVLGLVEQAGLGISLGVGLRGVHITLAIHHLIVFPVDDRTSCHAYLERLRMAAHQVGRHESAEAPSVHTDTVGIDVGQRLQIGHTRHLVSHLHSVLSLLCSVRFLLSVWFAPAEVLPM